MKDFISTYKNPNEERFNFPLIDREHDKSLVEYIANSCKSLEVMPEIEFLGYDLIEDEKQIDINNYISSRKKTSTKDPVKYMYMQDSRYMEMRIKFRLTTTSPNTGLEIKLINKRLLVPIPDDDGFYTIKGKKYFLMYQLVDASTYTSRNDVVSKSLMPVVVRRHIKEYTDTDGVMHRAATYVVLIFRKEVEVLQLYFAKIGTKKTLAYFGVEGLITFTDKEHDKVSNIYFPISNKMYLEVNRYYFEKYPYVQSVAFMILNMEGVTNRLTPDMLEDRVFWTERLGSLTVTNAYNYYEKGQNLLTQFTRMMDETTKEILKLDPSNRKSIFTVVRWMIQNYNELRKKDNMDLTNKRLRCNEYVAGLLTQAFSERMNRAISGKKVGMKKLTDIFKFQGNLLMERLYSSGLLRFDDRINDMNFFSKLMFTQKGLNAHGGKNAHSMQTKYRGIHPSFLGHIDLNVCSSSDPGSGGTLTPFCETEGLYFSSAREPEDGIYELQKDIRQKYKEEHPNRTVINMYEDCGNIHDEFRIRNDARELIRSSSVTRHTRPGLIRVRFKSDIDYDDI